MGFFCLGLKTIYHNHYYLHGIAFCATTLVYLTISDCEITNCSFELPALKFLFLFVVHIEDDDFKDLIAGCPQIQKLHNIVVSNHELNFFGVNLDCFDGKIRIESANLESLEFISFNMDFCEVETTSTTTVRELTLRKTYGQETLMNFIDKFPLLEKLIIDDCESHERPSEYDCDVDELFLRMTLEDSPTKKLLPLLKFLSLFNICIEDVDFKDLVVGCPRIEKLRILDTQNLHTIVVSNPRLKFFAMHLPYSDAKMRIESANLDSIELISFIEDLCEVEITSTTTVKELTLRRAYDRKILIHFTNKFPLLEKLKIDDCNILSEAEINTKPTIRNLISCNIYEEDTTWMNFIDKLPLLEKLNRNWLA
ncbi:hypothetical protein MTR67_032561 [Solanum verrucosum]|uniref:F-box/LRR-repeat protein 15/At3g58940/PEG3-like LRR domain-containing protein n=1 Tax=Solanum verrucosum TaxID=315347 RepID=A0AAF0U4R2_SOLVR|nr:hypothetical protein MTR67_032561 [Solanum verrucosum]